MLSRSTATRRMLITTILSNLKPINQLELINLSLKSIRMQIYNKIIRSKPILIANGSKSNQTVKPFNFKITIIATTSRVISKFTLSMAQARPN